MPSSLFRSEVFERAKTKYLEHIRNVQQDLNETRQLIEKEAEFKSHQESAYQQLIDERRHLLTRYKTAISDTNKTALISSSTVATVDHPPTHPHQISNITLYRQVFSPSRSNT